MRHRYWCSSRCLGARRGGGGGGGRLTPDDGNIDIGTLGGHHALTDCTLWEDTAHCAIATSGRGVGGRGGREREGTRGQGRLLVGHQIM